MPTLASDLIDEISAELHGWGSTADRVTELAGTITASDLSFNVAAATGQSVGISPGVVEIGSELLYVVSVDTTNGAVTLAPGFGRGYKNTTATTHAAGATVVSRPRFPRTWLLKQLNEVIGGLYPQLYAVKTYTGTVTWPSDTYAIDGTLLHVIDAQWQDPLGNWNKCPAYTVDPFDASFRLGSGPMIGRPLRVVYAAEPTQFASETDNFTVTGLPSSCTDLLVMAVVARQVPGLDISRAQLTSVEQSDRSRVVPPNAGVTASKYLMQMYLQRLDNEATSLRKRYKPRLVKVW